MLGWHLIALLEGKSHRSAYEIIPCSVAHITSSWTSIFRNTCIQFICEAKWKRQMIMNLLSCKAVRIWKVRSSDFWVSSSLSTLSFCFHTKTSLICQTDFLHLPWPRSAQWKPGRANVLLLKVTDWLWPEKSDWNSLADKECFSSSSSFSPQINTVGNYAKQQSVNVIIFLPENPVSQHMISVCLSVSTGAIYSGV